MSVPCTSTDRRAGAWRRSGGSGPVGRGLRVAGSGSWVVGLGCGIWVVHAAPHQGDDEARTKPRDTHNPTSRPPVGTDSHVAAAGQKPNGRLDLEIPPVGLEPTRPDSGRQARNPYGHQHPKLACLPVPPRGRDEGPAWRPRGISCKDSVAARGFTSPLAPGHALVGGAKGAVDLGCCHGSGASSDAFGRAIVRALARCRGFLWPRRA